MTGHRHRCYQRRLCELGRPRLLSVLGNGLEHLRDGPTAQQQQGCAAGAAYR